MGFTPRESCSWAHRFDDCRQEYRTLYCAERRITCFREALAGFRPNARAIAEYRNLFGKAPDLAGSVPRDWLEQRALAPGRLEIREGELVSIDEPALRREFERQHAGLLKAHGMEHLDIAELRSRNRFVTQTLSRFVFGRGAAGIIYCSNLDDLPCVALFEGPALVTPDGEPEALVDSPSELLEVCKEFGLACTTGR